MKIALTQKNLMLKAVVLCLLTFSLKNIRADARMLNLPGHAANAYGYSVSQGGVGEVFRNPAASSYSDKPLASWAATSGLHSLFQDVNVVHLAGIAPATKYGSLGAGVAYLSAGDFDRTDDTGQVTGIAQASDMLGYLNYSQYAAYEVALGVNFKYFSSQLADFQASAFAADVSTYRKFAFSDFLVGTSLAIRNVGTELRFDKTGQPLPVEYSAGTDVSWPLPYALRLLAGVGFITREGNSGVLPGAALEYEKSTFSLSARVSYQTIDANAPLGMGIGFRYKKSDYEYDVSASYSPASVSGSQFFLSLTVAGVGTPNRENVSRNNEIGEPASKQERYELIMRFFSDNLRKKAISRKDTAEDIIVKAGKHFKKDLQSGEGKFIFLPEYQCLLFYPAEGKARHSVTTSEGSVLSGEVLSADKEKINIKTMGGNLAIPRKEVKSVSDANY